MVAQRGKVGSTKTGSAYFGRSRAGPHLFWGLVRVGGQLKAYRTYAEQVALLGERGMLIDDEASAAAVLARVNYYRLSGYWYPFRVLRDGGRADAFYPGTRFDDVVALYEFDARLRAATFEALMPIELAVRTLLGHELGRVDPQAHLDPSLLGAVARKGWDHAKWMKRYKAVLERSREDFVAHHQQKYGGQMPVWVAVELLDWGSLSRLYDFSPRPVQEAVAGACSLRAPQLGSWLKVLNVARNTCAHHGRYFNRVHALTPKLPRAGVHRDLDAVDADWTRTFGQLTLIQFLLDRLGVGSAELLPEVVATFPEIRLLPLSHMGVPVGWRDSSPIWRGRCV